MLFRLTLAIVSTLVLGFAAPVESQNVEDSQPSTRYTLGITNELVDAYRSIINELEDAREQFPSGLPLEECRPVEALPNGSYKRSCERCRIVECNWLICDCPDAYREWSDVFGGPAPRRHYYGAALDLRTCGPGQSVGNEKGELVCEGPAAPDGGAGATGLGRGVDPL